MNIKQKNAREDKLTMMQKIKGYSFDLSQPIYLNSPKRKFWQVSIEQTKVTYRAGVLRQNNQEHKVLSLVKQYDSETLARATVITKIAGKIQKGYFSITAQKQEKPVIQKKARKSKKAILEQEQQTKRKKFVEELNEKPPKSSKGIVPLESNKKLWKGLQKNGENIQMEVIGNLVKIVRADSIKQIEQLKTFSKYQQAVDFVHREEKFLVKQGYKPRQSEAYLQQQKSKKTNKKDKSLTNMTDQSMPTSSVPLIQNSIKNMYLPNPRLGPPIDHCIKCLLAQNFTQKTDPTNMIMSQKLDGVRCLWTGNQMFSRNGNKFSFPSFFTKNWPNSQLDGQLFMGRGKFSQTLSCIRKNVPINAEWQNLRYLVFDAPGLQQPFRYRIKMLQEQLAKIDSPYLICHAHRPCLGLPDLFTELDKVNKAQGQGIMLRAPQSLYEFKRSKSLQKVKTFHDDEAVIIGYKAGTGRCADWVGALRVRNGQGVEFEVGSGLNDELRMKPPGIGQWITYRYQQFNKESGKPRFPTFVRVYNPI